MIALRNTAITWKLNNIQQFCCSCTYVELLKNVNHILRGIRSNFKRTFHCLELFDYFYIVLYEGCSIKLNNVK